MDDARESQDGGQHPHTPGQDPQGSGEPRDPAARPDDPQGPQYRAPVEPGSQREPHPDHRSGDDGDAPLGGDQSTEDRLEADTAVEEDALRALDPDDTPA